MVFIAFVIATATLVLAASDMQFSISTFNLQPYDPLKEIASRKLQGYIALALLVAIGAVIFLDALRRRVFPMEVFTIGQRKKRHEMLGWIRVSLLLPVALIVISAVIGL